MVFIYFIESEKAHSECGGENGGDADQTSVKKFEDIFNRCKDKMSENKLNVTKQTWKSLSIELNKTNMQKSEFNAQNSDYLSIRDLFCRYAPFISSGTAEWKWHGLTFH